MGHPMPHSILSLGIGNNEIQAELKLPLNELQLAVPFDVTNNTTSLIEQNEQALKKYLLSHIQLKSNDNKLWNINIDGFKLSEEEQIATGKYRELISYLTFIPPPKSDLRNFYLDYDVIIHQVVTHKIFLTLQQDWKNGKLDTSETTLGVIELDIANNRVNPLHVQLDKGSNWNGFVSMVKLGMHHISEGTDHLMFLFVLLLPATLLAENRRWTKFKGTPKSITQLLKIVTAFTVGHSLTLIIGSLKIVNLPTQPVEILIALTIIITAIHALRPIFPQKEMFIACAFGLVHGLAFSSILSEIKLSGSEMAYSILGFNIGIELMQLFVLLLIVPWLLILSQYPIYKWIRIVGATLSIIAAIGWLIERITLNPNFISLNIEYLANYGKYVVLFLALLTAITMGLMNKKANSNP